MLFETPNGKIKFVCYVGIIKDDRILLVEYENPPNPEKKGWHVPTLELNFGEHPEDQVKGILKDFGIRPGHIKLVNTESTLDSQRTWHMLYYFRVDTTDDLFRAKNVRRHGWFLANGLPHPIEQQHGKWEQNLALSFLV